MINSIIWEFVTPLCAPQTQRLVVVPRGGLGDIYLLEADGTPVVRYQWSDFRHVAILEDAEGYTVAPDTGGVNRFRGGAVIRYSLALLQNKIVSAADLTAREGATRIQTMVLNLRSGEVVSQSAEWPVVLDYASGGAVKLLDTDWPGFRVCRGARR